MQASARLYTLTGFDSVNVPYDEDVLKAYAKNADSTKDTYVVDVNDIYTLTSLRIPLGEHTLDEFHALMPQVDYIGLTLTYGTDNNVTAYYYAYGLTYTSVDVAQFSLAIDPVLSMSPHGWESLQLSAGVITRSYQHPVLNMLDPYLQACVIEPLVTRTVAYGASTAYGKVEYNKIAALTVDPKTIADWNWDSTNVNDGISVFHFKLGGKTSSERTPGDKDPGDSGNQDWGDSTKGDIDLEGSIGKGYTLKNKIVPAKPTTIEINIPKVTLSGGSGSHGGVVSYETRGYGLYDMTNENVQNGINTLHGLGMLENSLIASYCIPVDYVDDSTKQWSESGEIPRILSKDNDSWDWRPLKATDEELQDEDRLTDEEFEVACSSGYCKTGIMSPVTGQSIEQDQRTVINKIFCMVDLSPEGRPYFALVPRDADGTNNPDTDEGNIPAVQYVFSRYGIAGGRWFSQPIVQMGASGNIKDAIMLSINNRIADQKANIDSQRYELGLAKEATMATVNLAASMALPSSSTSLVPYGSYAAQEPTSSAITRFLGAGNNYLQEIAGNIFNSPVYSQAEYAKKMREYEKSKEVAQFFLDDYAVAPSVTGITLDSTQLAFGNGVIAYEYHPSSNSVSRMIETCQLFGRADHTVISSATYLRGWLEGAGMPSTSHWWNNGINCAYIQVASAHVALRSSVIKYAQREMLRMIEDELATGIRIWKE